MADEQAPPESLYRVTELFRVTQESKKRVIIHQGGTSSGKTYAILQNLFLKALQYEGIVITVVGQDIPNLKKGALRDALKIYNQSPILKKNCQDYNRTERIFTFKNGSVIEFNSYADQQDAKSGKRDFLFINEADGVTWEIYWQLSIRTLSSRPEILSQIFIDYNPSVIFWAHEKLKNKEDTVIFYSDHRDNPFLDANTHKEIEAIADPEMWKVYARGITGNLRGSIYPNWQIVEEFPKNIDEVIWAIDYGYTSDPTAIVKIGIQRPRTIYLEEISYVPGISEHQINEAMEAAGWINGQPFYSEHDREMVSSLRRLGVYVLMAKKGEGSKRNGILKVKQFSVNYTRRSIHIHEERMKYKWSYVGDTPTNTPDKSPDHLMDAVRYGIYTHFFGE